jgi:hypothetical protein
MICVFAANNIFDTIVVTITSFDDNMIYYAAILAPLENYDPLTSHTESYIQIWLWNNQDLHHALLLHTHSFMAWLAWCFDVFVLVLNIYHLNIW